MHIKIAEEQTKCLKFEQREPQYGINSPQSQSQPNFKRKKCVKSKFNDNSLEKFVRKRCDFRVPRELNLEEVIPRGRSRKKECFR